MLTHEEIDELMKKNTGLSKQTYEDIPKLTPLSNQVISRQATINIGTIGHVSHGKSTLVKAISGIHVNHNIFFILTNFFRLCVFN